MNCEKKRKIQPKKKSKQQHKISILDVTRTLLQHQETKPRRKYTPGLKNSRTSLFLSSYLDRLLRSVRYRESHTFWTALCNERAREVCPHNGARGKHPLFNPFVYFFSSRKLNTNLAPDDSYIKKTSHKTKQKNEEQTNEKQHFTPEDLFPFYYPSKTPEREYNITLFV